MAVRVVFDTNILISALLSMKGAPFRALALARTGAVQSVTCQAILDEFAEKLMTKFHFTEERMQQVVDEVAAFSELVQVPGNLRVVPNDPDDDVIVECALVGSATIVVSGDKHLLALGTYQTVRMLSANEFLRSI